MIQLWVNLPAKDKMTPPRYQGILSQQIPSVALPDGSGSVRVIAGEYAGAKGPAKTFTPIHLWDLRLAGGQPIDLPLPDGYTTALVMLKGTLTVADGGTVGAGEVAVFDRAGSVLRIEATNDTTALLLCGQPIDEPIVGSGPFVMNTREEIEQAYRDFQSGRMGRIEA
jgi:redox-sensitive bicupin YhaK (pirin superfamily)